VPVEYREWFYFDHQYMRKRPGGGRNDSIILMQCKLCVNIFPTLINSVRQTMKRTGRFVGLCGECKRDRKWIEDGYVIIYKPDHPNARKDGKILEHIYVMSKYIGRPLEKHENVHHKSGDRSDNRISNLELWSTSQPAGQRVEDKLMWAKEMIELYPKEWAELNGR
jgi:hypothetical protein